MKINTTGAFMLGITYALSREACLQIIHTWIRDDAFVQPVNILYIVGAGFACGLLLESARK